MLIRAAKPEDAIAIGHVHVASWRTTYRGLMPDSVLAALSVEQRAAMWQQAAEGAQEGASRSFLLVAEDQAEGIIGFASAGPERDEGSGFDSELYAIYLLERHQGRGLGRQLAGRAVNLLLSEGHESMRVWVLEGNPAEGFYRRLGGQRVGEKALSMAGKNLTEVAYAWPHLSRFYDLASLSRRRQSE